MKNPRKENLEGKIAQLKRQLEIEAALETVRAKTMGMQKSSELRDVTIILYEQLKHLGFTQGAASIIIIDGTKGDLEWWMEGSGDGYNFLESYHVPNFDHLIHIEMLTNWKNKVPFAITKISGELKKSFDDYYFTYTDFVHTPEETKKFMTQKDTIFFSIAYMLYGGLCWTETAVDDEQAKILQHFAKVFEQTYTRFNDLKNAESAAREANIEAALERIRSRALAMQHSVELKAVMSEMFHRLTELDVLMGTVAVQLFDPVTKVCTFWLGNDKQQPAMVKLPYDENMLSQDNYMRDSWQARSSGKSFFNKVYSYEQNQKHFHYVFANNDTDTIPLTVREFILKAPSHLYCLIIEKNSALVADNFYNQFYSDYQIDVLKRTAKVFDQAYVRFKDLELAESNALEAEQNLIRIQAEKKRAEDALTNLKATQAQLVQAEKMASLGVLTAGIAHEIQNPLNFVNNFSEMNKEMIEELEDELKSGNIDEALSIAADIKQNEVKINHHGKRADTIIKGMLEHSRVGSGNKEPTDINKLADEYLRLSYHGLRAKDKSFNAEMITNFDEKLPLVNVIPQDIGRVLLNLFNNAFYAVNQKAKIAGVDYNPKVELETFFIPLLGVGGLKVKDNGIGIPDAIKDKIMQPFFTTKPTGEGTGLGLSLSYDMVVKGHGGTIEIDSKEGEFTVFKVSLPLNA